MANTVWKGTKANDTHSGTEFTQYGYAGNDTLTNTAATGTRLYGGGGDDTLAGGAGNDSLYGGDGIDTITTGAGNDRAYGGNGNDVITGGAGNDVLSGDNGNDTITGGAGNQTLLGGSGNDSLDTGTDATVTDKHVLNGGTGADALTATNSSGKDTLNGGTGNDTLTGSAAGSDTLIGGADVNSILGNATNHANETLGYGFVGKGIADVTNGGFVGATVSLSAGTGSASWTPVGGVLTTVTDTISNVDHINGSAYNDTLTGNLFGNKISGGLGADSVDSGGTSTSLAAGAANTGNDTLLSGYGNDTIVMHNGSQALDSIDGGAGTKDLVTFANVFANASIATAAGANAMYAAGTATGVVINLSSDISAGVNFQGAAGSGHINGVEKIIGTSGADYVTSVGGATIDTGAGNDTIIGAQTGSGIDILKGGAGTNTYDATSATAKDYFGVGNAATELDNIYAYNGVQDKFYVSLASYSTAGHAVLAASYTGAGTTVSPYVLNAGDMVVNTTAVAGANVGTVAAQSQFVYNSTTGNLFFDADGSGAGIGVQVAHLDTNTFASAHTVGAVLDNTDFILVA